MSGPARDGGKGKVDCKDALAQLVAKNATLKAAAARQDVKEKNQNVPFVKMNGHDWVRIHAN
jgi:hypothetical protein